jgi:S1-C subfamily serine protease
MVLTASSARVLGAAALVTACLAPSGGRALGQEPAGAATAAPVDPTARTPAPPAATPARVQATAPSGRMVRVARPTDDDALRQQRRTAWLGIGLSCTRCSYHTEGKSISRWVFNEFPVLYQVDPGSPADRGGLRTGDTLVAINGLPLTSARGGQAFANLTPGVAVRLSYRRAGRDRSVAVRPEQAPAQRELADLRDAAEARERAARAQEEAARDLGRTYQQDAERAQRELERAQEELYRNRGKVLSEESSRRIREFVQQAQRVLESTPTLPDAAPAAVPPPVVESSRPTLPAPTPAPAPTPRSLGWAVTPPGGLRYSGRLGSAVIEARRPGGVDVIETGDSEVVLRGGDLSVRIALDRRGNAVVRAPSVSPGWSMARSDRGDITRGLLGYLVNPRLGRTLGATAGVLVLDVADGSHADSLGILPGDVLVLLNDHAVVSLTSEESPGGGRTLRRGTPQPGAQSAVVIRGRVRRHLFLARPARPAPTAPRRNP